MIYIHEAPDWPQFRWDEAKLSPLLAEVRHQHGRLLGRMEGLGFELRSEASLVTLTADVVKSSAIEGEVLDPGQVRSSIARRLGLDAGGFVQPSRDVEGIVEMMLDATRNHAEPLTANRLFGWHSALFPGGRSGMTKITIGAWRPAEAGAMQIVSGPVGREKVHFEAPPAERLEDEMNAFLCWLEEKQNLDPVLKAGIAHFWFVTVHPFEDGNGRIGRAIVDMLLARAEGSPDRFYSMSSQIDLERGEYYRHLERSQRGTLDITAWLEWFLGCLDHAFQKTGILLSSVTRKARLWEIANTKQLNSRQRTVLNRLLDGFQGPLTSSKYAKLAKCSEDTALRDIRGLLEAGILRQNTGGGRSTSYSVTEI